MDPTKKKISCKYCSDSFSSLLRHISKSNCKEKYSQGEIDALHQQSKEQHRANTKMWKKDNKEAVAAINAKYYKSHKSSISDINKVQNNYKNEQVIKETLKEKRLDVPSSFESTESISMNSNFDHNAISIRKRKPIDFTMSDLEEEAEDDDDKEFVINSVPILSRKILPKRNCNKNND